MRLLGGFSSPAERRRFDPAGGQVEGPVDLGAVEHDSALGAETAIEHEFAGPHAAGGGQKAHDRAGVAAEELGVAAGPLPTAADHLHARGGVVNPQRHAEGGVDPRVSERRFDAVDPRGDVVAEVLRQLRQARRGVGLQR